MRPRHRGLLFAFLLIVLLPLLVSAAYLWIFAQDQYASTVGFTVRREERSSAVDLLGGLSRITEIPVDLRRSHSRDEVLAEFGDTITARAERSDGPADEAGVPAHRDHGEVPVPAVPDHVRHLSAGLGPDHATDRAGTPEPVGGGRRGGFLDPRGSQDGGQVAEPLR